MIPVRNLYHMMAYAFEGLRADTFRRCGEEDFESAADLLAEMLIIQMSDQLRRGIRMGYREVSEETSQPKGRIDIGRSMVSSMLSKSLVCEYDEFTANVMENRIAVTVLSLLLESDIDSGRKGRIRRLLAAMRGIEAVDPRRIRWDSVNTRGSIQYTSIMSVCRLVLDGLLPNGSDGRTGLMSYLDVQAESRLYEKFLRAYFIKEHPELKVSSPRIDWDVGIGSDGFLPDMWTDMVLESGGKELIIDAKYYRDNMQDVFGSRKIHSGNLYQIYAYVKNRAAHAGAVSGMLLYAATDAKVQPMSSYDMGRNMILVRALDLGKDFPQIAEALDGIAGDFMNGSYWPPATMNETEHCNQYNVRD